MRRRLVDPDLVRTVCDRAREVARLSTSAPTSYAGSIQAGGVTAACTRSRKPGGPSSTDVLTKSAAAVAPTTRREGEHSASGAPSDQTQESSFRAGVDPRSHVVSRAEARRRASSLGAATPPRKLRKRLKLIHADQLLTSRVGQGLCPPRARVVRPRVPDARPHTHVPNPTLRAPRAISWTLKVGERVEKARVAFPRPHRRESACQPRAEGRIEDARGRLVVVDDPGSTPLRAYARSWRSSARRLRWSRCVAMPYSHGRTRRRLDTWHAARRRSRTSAQPARRRDRVQRVDGDTGARHRSADRRSARRPSAHAASAPGNPRPTKLAPPPVCARSIKRSFTTVAGVAIRRGARCERRPLTSGASQWRRAALVPTGYGGRPDQHRPHGSIGRRSEARRRRPDRLARLRGQPWSGAALAHDDDL